MLEKIRRKLTDFCDLPSLIHDFEVTERQHDTEKEQQALEKGD